MQWPCPTGFHVPTKNENVALVAAMTALGIDTSNWNCMKTYLKMPFAGNRGYSSAGVTFQGYYAAYWSSTAYSAVSAYYLSFHSDVLVPQDVNYRSYGLSVRCFKNSPLQPTSSWTTLFDGSWIAAGAWIFHNTTDWVISISSDWTNWITIADKNLWATTVYNDGDTLSQANCWNYYQRWNNYGFPRTWSVTTSSTQVDASNYWPWNYYNSSTFITRSSSPYDWSSVQNDNLRWWVTWWEKEIKKVCMWIWGTEKQIRPAWWTPWANTVMYFPFKNDKLDHVGSATIGITGTQASLWYTFSFSWEASVTNSPTNCRFVSYYIKWNSSNWNYVQSPWTYLGRMTYNFYHVNSSYTQRFEFADTSSSEIKSNQYSTTTWTWYHFAMWRNGTKVYAYVNWVNVWETSCSTEHHLSNIKFWQGINMTISEYIGESVCWTAQEVSDYYNQTKWNYWL